jgi:hypothetical protein
MNNTGTDQPPLNCSFQADTVCSKDRCADYTFLQDTGCTYMFHDYYNHLQSDIVLTFDLDTSTEYDISYTRVPAFQNHQVNKNH